MMLIIKPNPYCRKGMETVTLLSTACVDNLEKWPKVDPKDAIVC